MGKMVNRLTKRELSASFAIIDRIARGSSQPYTRAFVPQVVATNNQLPNQNVVRESSFQLKEQTSDNVVIMRANQNVRTTYSNDIIFPDAFYEYFEVIDNTPSKVG
tara:strand:+ start:41692 stop:42009 length:318 start_codon:yes stop_codon:yes gene_type:complete